MLVDLTGIESALKSQAAGTCCFARAPWSLGSLPSGWCPARRRRSSCLRQKGSDHGVRGRQYDPR